MLIALGVDADSVVHRGLVLCALICCALVGLSFAMFVTDRLSTASQQQAAEVNSSGPRSATQPSSEGQPRRFIDGAARALTSPFRSLINSTSLWTEEGVSTILALIVYGLGLGYLARYARVS